VTSPCPHPLPRGKYRLIQARSSLAITLKPTKIALYCLVVRELKSCSISAVVQQVWETMQTFYISSVHQVQTLSKVVAALPRNQALHSGHTLQSKLNGSLAVAQVGGRVSLYDKSTYSGRPGWNLSVHQNFVSQQGCDSPQDWSKNGD